MSRRGISSTVVTLLGVMALLIGMVAFTAIAVYLARAAQSANEAAGSYAGESKAVVKVYAILEMEKSGDILLNKTYLILENLWPDEVTVDHVVVASKSGSIIAEKNLNMKLKPGESTQMRPSDIDPSLLAYDNDFWRFKREVGSIEIHADVGRQGVAFKAYPGYRAFINQYGAAPTSTTQSGSYTSTVTVTTTITSTSTYFTTPTRTVTTTCTYKACIQREYQTGYITTRLQAPTTVTVTQSSFVTSGWCIIRPTSTTLYLTSTSTTIVTAKIGDVTCAVCGVCPAGTYQAPGYSQSGHSIPYLTAMVLALTLLPSYGRLSARGRLGLILTALLVSLLVERISLTVGAASSTFTATTSTVTVTITSTVTLTAPPATSTATSTIISTETRCRGVQTTITVIDRPIQIFTTTRQITKSCLRLMTIYNTVTQVSLGRTLTTYTASLHSLTCQSTVQ